MFTAFKSLIAGSIALATLAGCGGGSSSEPASKQASTEKKVQRPAVQTQTIASACDWLPLADVEQVLGKMPKPPRRGFSAENARPDENGYACVYTTSVAGDVQEVAVQMNLYGAVEFESAMGMVGNMLSAELNDGHAAAPSGESNKRTDGWDYVGNMPGIGVWRIGHVAVMIGSPGYNVPQETLNKLAVAIRDRLGDMPFAQAGRDPNAPGSAPDPCALVTRAEAEAVLGTLLVDPYRSAESGPIADGEGPSCSFYSQGHRALVITPTLSDGEMMFGMAGGVNGLVRSKTGGADEGDLLDGPWDNATAGTTGALYFLKGDSMLEVVYKTSATDIEGAAKIAAAAVGRFPASAKAN